MKEPTLGGIEASAGDSRRNFVPCHSAVYVLEAVAALMAVELIFGREIFATTAVLRNALNQLHDPRCASLLQVVNRVAAISRFWKVADGVFNSQFALDRFGEWYFDSQAGDVDEPLPALRYTVLSCIQDILITAVSSVLHATAENLEAFVVRQPRHVLDHYCLGT